MRSKRGDLAVEEIVKLVLGVLVFLFILFILFSLGKIITGNLRAEQAKATLDNIVFEAGKLTNEGDYKKVLVESPSKGLFTTYKKHLCIAIDKSSEPICESSDINFSISGICSSKQSESILGSYTSASVGCVYIYSVPFSLFIQNFSGKIFVTAVPVSSLNLTWFVGDKEVSVGMVSTSVSAVTSINAPGAGYFSQVKPEVNESFYLDLSSLFTENSTKQSIFLDAHPKLSPRLEKIAYGSELVGNMLRDTYLVLYKDGAVRVVMSDPTETTVSEYFKDTILFVDKEGVVWAAKDILDSISNIDSSIIFYDQTKDVENMYESSVVSVVGSPGGMGSESKAYFSYSDRSEATLTKTNILVKGLD